MRQIFLFAHHDTQFSVSSNILLRIILQLLELRFEFWPLYNFIPIIHEVFRIQLVDGVMKKRKFAEGTACNIRYRAGGTEEVKCLGQNRLQHKAMSDSIQSFRIGNGSKSADLRLLRTRSEGNFVHVNVVQDRMEEIEIVKNVDDATRDLLRSAVWGGGVREI